QVVFFLVGFPVYSDRPLRAAPGCVTDPIAVGASHQAVPKRARMQLPERHLAGQQPDSCPWIAISDAPALCALTDSATRILLAGTQRGKESLDHAGEEVAHGWTFPSRERRK